MERLLSVPEASLILGIGQRKTWAAVHDQELRTLRIGTRVLIRPQDLEAFAESKLVAAE